MVLQKYFQLDFCFAIINFKIFLKLSYFNKCFLKLSIFFSQNPEKRGNIRFNLTTQTWQVC